MVSILISSHFLEMSRLVDECLVFLHNRFNAIVKLPIDLNCVNKVLLERLAALFKDKELEHLKDRKDKLLSKIYMKRLEFMFRNPDNMLYDTCKQHLPILTTRCSQLTT